MPNHVKNVVRFKNLKTKNDIDFILNTIATKLDDPDYPKTLPPEYIIDFDKIIPEPRTIEECPAECIATKESHISEDEERPWFNWYQWHIANWGTKWNAYSGYTKIGKTQIAFVFNTAWAPPMPVFERLRLLGYDIDIKYADEDYGNNCGALTYSVKDKCWDEYTEDSYRMKNPDKFARNLWDRY